MADDNSLEIKQLLIGFQKASGQSIRNWNPKRLYELLRLLGNQTGGLQTEINNINTQLSGGVTPPDEVGLTHGQVMRRISVRI